MKPILHALPITAFILTLIYKWFALDDRYAIFLYDHMQAQPFDDVTIGRYWMMANLRQRPIRQGGV